MKLSSIRTTCCFVVTIVTGLACSGTSGSGTSSNGGSITSNGSGGTKTAGGSGGTSGIAQATGGSATGGTHTGSGAIASGGTTANSTAASGGRATGGTNGGGIATGGTNVGVTSATGGAATGGRAAGGAATGGVATGGRATGGAATGGSGALTQCATGGTGPFTLAWQDDFNTLNTSMWQLQSFTYAGNLAQFTPQNAAVANGILTISLTPNSASTTEPYYGVEMRSAQTLTYGKLSARMRFATGSGVVSGLVLFYTPYPNCNWNEIDIEHLGNSSNTSQLNCQVYTGTVVPSCTTSVTPTQDPLVVNLGFNAETDFHLYDIEWTPSSVKFYADCVLLRTWTANIAKMNLAQTILLTIWASSASSWAGPINSSSAPTSAQVDWIKVYSWTG